MTSQIKENRTELGLDSLAIFCECDDITHHIICAELNRIEGARTTVEERLAQAAELLRMYPGQMTTEQAANALHVPVASLQRYRRHSDCRDMLMASGLPPEKVNGIPSNQMDCVARSINTRAVAIELAKAAMKKGCSSKKLRGLVATADSFGTEAERISFIREKSDWSTTKKRALELKRPVYTSFTRSISLLESITENKENYQSLQIDSQEIGALQQRWESLNERISTLLNASSTEVAWQKQSAQQP